MANSIVPDYDWHPTDRCHQHGIPTALCMDGLYRCVMCEDDRLLRFAFVRKE